MDIIILQAGAAKLVYLLISLAALVYWLRFLDRRAGVDFKEFFNDLKNDPRAAAQYLAFRFLGACILIGLALF